MRTSDLWSRQVLDENQATLDDGGAVILFTHLLSSQSGLYIYQNIR